MTLTQLRVELVPPPDPECREREVPCQGCHTVATMHTSGRCHRCGDWLLTVDADAVRAGDWVLWGRWWWQVTAVARTRDRHGLPVVSLGMDNCKALTLRPDAHVHVAANLRTVDA